ncbi:hypothetical protein M3Y97_00057500 [Aphelenchoides bicaudatus]|nr:hypothetical protein M3Y97_00057500 [Aphelenchoides bicaudatus]
MSKIFGFVEAGKSTDFLVTRTNGAANKDRFVVEYCAVEKDVTDPTQQFKKTGKAVNSVNIYCNAVSNKSVAPSFAPAIMRPVTSTMLTSSVQPDPDKSSASTQLKSIYTPTVVPKE